MRRLAVPLLFALLAACDHINPDAEETAPTLDAAAREKVVSEVLSRLDASYAEVGPQFHTRLPAIKNDVATGNGYAGWEDFQNRLHATDPAIEIEVSRRITRRIRDLIDRKPG